MMDRSFLSNTKVIEASRNFVCVRLVTYEDAAEAKFLEELYRGRTGNLEITKAVHRSIRTPTVFAMLSPDGKQRLDRPGRALARQGRGPPYRNAAQMAGNMNQLTNRDFSSLNEKRWADSALPEMKSMELALNVASCDGLPTIVSIADSEAELKKMQTQLLSIAWSDEFAGQFVYASANSKDDVRALAGLKVQKGIFVVAPGPYGMSGKVMLAFDTNTSQQEKASELRKLLASYDPPEKKHRTHVRFGVQFGLKWKTRVPITDVMSIHATKRVWGED